VPGEPAAGVCVFCRQRPIHPAWRPFCSERCKLQDLARWVDGAYRVAAPLEDAEEKTTERGGDEE